MTKEQTIQVTKNPIIDFDIYDHKELDLSLLNKSLEEEKAYYESQGLTCTVREY